MLRRWFKRRSLTISLVVFFVAWYIAQLYVLSILGAEMAFWWFYFDGTLSPGYLLAPISHNVADIGHLKRNVAILLLVGGVTEPYVENGKYVALLLVISFGSIGIANLMSLLVGTQWVLAGASGGIFGLWAFIGVKNRSLVLSETDLRELVEARIILAGLLTPLFIPIYDVYTTGLLNMSHLVGILLGYVAALVESPPRMETLSE